MKKILILHIILLFGCVWVAKAQPDSLVFTKDSLFLAEDSTAVDSVEVPLGISARSILESYIDAIGGQDNIDDIKTIKIEYIVKSDNEIYQIEEYYKLPDRMSKMLILNGKLIEQKVYDGRHGLISGVRGTYNPENKELLELEYESYFFIELYYDKLDFTIELDRNLEKIFDKTAYKLHIYTPSGKSYTDYFDMRTGLKLTTFEIIPGVQKGEEIKIITDYKDYREAEGVWFPTIIERNINSHLFYYKMKNIEINPKIDKDIFSTKID